MVDSCHECVWVIGRLNQEFSNLYNAYDKIKNENEKYKKKLNLKTNINKKSYHTSEKIIFKDFNYHRVPLD